MARPRLGPNRQPWKGIDANERAYNTVHNALVGIILDGVVGMSPDLGHRQIAPEKADEYLDRGRRVLADFESQNPAPGGSRGRAQFWMENKIRELRRLLSDAEAVRSGAKPQKQTPESYGELRKHLGVASPGKGGGVWGIWDAGRKQWMPDPLKGHIDTSPAKYKSKAEAERKADHEWRQHNPNDRFEVRPMRESARYPQPSPPPRRFVSPRAAEKYASVPITRVVIQKGDPDLIRQGASKQAARNNWVAKVYDSNGHLRSGVNAPDLEYVKKKIEEWFPGVPVEYKDGAPGAVREGHRVADFNTLDDLAQHARGEGATHIMHIDDEVHLYFRRSDGKYEKAEVWQKDGYWHTQAPGSRAVVQKPPQGAKAIGGRGAVTETGSRMREAGSPIDVLRTLRPGDMVTIESRELPKPRKVLVLRMGSGEDNVYVSSGRVHPGNRSDGHLYATRDGQVYFQPTMRQQNVRVSRLTRTAAAMAEARRGGSTPSPVDRRTARGAESRGEQYAQDQLQGDYFMNWVREQLAEAARMPPEDVLPLETKQDAMVIAKNMLQQLEWDAKRDLQEDKAFWEGFGEVLYASREWLADELLSTKNGDQIFKKARVEARRAPKAGTSAAEPGGMRDVLKGWSVGWNDEISASAAVRDLRSKGGRRRIVVMTQDDHEPRNPNASVELGLYELADDEWVQVHYADFDTPADAVKAVQTDPAWA